MSKVGIWNDGPGIGDKLQFGAVPENYFRNFGEKLVDMSNCWVFDHNPYVTRGEHAEKQINLWYVQFPAEDYLSYGERQTIKFGWPKCYLRHPRLYKYEDAKINLGTVVVHTNGKSEGGVMSDETIAQIQKNYDGYRIIQIGGTSDRKTPFEQALGLSLWNSAELIATSQIFIGVNSSMMNIANCYPRIHRKVVINRTDVEKYYPVSVMSSWIDYNWTYINQTEEDLGVTYSYKKI